MDKLNQEAIIAELQNKFSVYLMDKKAELDTSDAYAIEWAVKEVLKIVTDHGD